MIKYRGHIYYAAYPNVEYVYSGWSCPAGPASFVNWLVDRGEEISYEEFAGAVNVGTAGLDSTQFEILSTDWAVTFLRTEMPSGQEAYVMQHSGIEHLFLPPSADPFEEATLMDDIVDWSEATYDEPWPERLSEDQIREMRKVFFTSE